MALQPILGPGRQSHIASTKYATLHDDLYLYSPNSDILYLLHINILNFQENTYTGCVSNSACYNQVISHFPDCGFGKVSHLIFKQAKHLNCTKVLNFVHKMFHVKAVHCYTGPVLSNKFTNLLF